MSHVCREEVRSSLPRILGLLSLFRFCQPSSFQLLHRNARKIGLDVEDGGTVQHVDAADLEGSALAAEQFHCGQADRIGTIRRARGEDAVLTAIAGWLAEQFE